MAQSDYELAAHVSGLNQRTEINSIFDSILTHNSGSTAPTVTKAFMMWVDTSNATYYYLKMRNHDNTAWVTLGIYTVATKTYTSYAEDTVKLTENQTIDGVKTFSSSPVVPTPINNGDAVNKKYVDTNGATLPIGALLNGYTIFENCIVAFGGEFNRADYPKLWAYLQANPSLVKTQAAWTTENTTNGMCGFFSDGNGTTTFRAPNLDKAFLRPDSRTVGSYQEGSYAVGDSVSSDTTQTWGLLNYDDNATAFRSRMNWDTITTVPMGATNLRSAVAGSGASANYVGAPAAFGVTRPKNIAVLPLIVAK